MLGLSSNRGKFNRTEASHHALNVQMGVSNVTFQTVSSEYDATFHTKRHSIGVGAVLVCAMHGGRVGGMLVQKNKT